MTLQFKIFGGIRNCEGWKKRCTEKPKAVCPLNFFNIEDIKACTDPESFVRGGPVLTFFPHFLVDEGREDPNTTKSRPSLACQRNCRADDGPTLNG